MEKTFNDVKIGDELYVVTNKNDLITVTVKNIINYNDLKEFIYTKDDNIIFIDSKLNLQFTNSSYDCTIYGSDIVGTCVEGFFKSWYTSKKEAVEKIILKLNNSLQELLIEKTSIEKRIEEYKNKLNDLKYYENV